MHTYVECREPSVWRPVPVCAGRTVVRPHAPDAGRFAAHRAGCSRRRL